MGLVEGILYYCEINIAYCDTKTSKVNDKTAYSISSFILVGHRIANAANKAHKMAHTSHRTEPNLFKSFICPTLHSHHWADKHFSTLTKAKEWVYIQQCVWQNLGGRNNNQHQLSIVQRFWQKNIF